MRRFVESLLDPGTFAQRYGARGFAGIVGARSGTLFVMPGASSGSIAASDKMARGPVQPVRRPSERLALVPAVPMGARARTWERESNL